MTVKLKLIALVLVVVGMISTERTLKDLAKRIENRYNDVDVRCFNSRGIEKPAYECSGLMIRGVKTKHNLRFAWTMTELNLEKEAFSVAYLRRDQQFSRFPRDYTSGYIIYPTLQTPRKKNVYKVYCAFPIDADSVNRDDDHGCGKSSKDTTQTSKPCGEQKIKTFNAWKSHFNDIVNSNNTDSTHFVTRQCGFDMRKSSAPKDFAIALAANKYARHHVPKYAFKNNELRMHAWNETRAEKIPIEAFFYLTNSTNGKRLAEEYQEEFYNECGEVVPIVGIQLPFGTQSFAATVEDENE